MNLLEGGDATHTLEKGDSIKMCVHMCVCMHTNTKLIELTGWPIGHRHSKSLQNA